MKIHRMRVYHSKIELIIYELEDGGTACPVCGYALAGEWPWGPIDETADDGVPYAFASFDICPCCNTHYGNEDCASTSEPDAILKRWEELRRRWIEKAGCGPEVVQQLRNIGIEVECPPGDPQV